MEIADSVPLVSKELEVRHQMRTLDTIKQFITRYLHLGPCILAVLVVTGGIIHRTAARAGSGGEKQRLKASRRWSVSPPSILDPQRDWTGPISHLFLDDFS